MQNVKLQKDTTLTIRINSTVKGALLDKAKSQDITLTEIITNLALRDLNTSAQDFKKLALGK
jgi:NMD protein affecting ribosome stability and mRNA decay